MEDKLPYIKGHIAVRVDHCIAVIGGQVCKDGHNIHNHSVWLYNLFIEQWKKYDIPENKQVPHSLIGACGAVIGEDIYTFGGKVVLSDLSNELWKLTQKYKCQL